MTNLNKPLIIFVSLLLVGFLLWYFQLIVGYVIISWVLSMLGQPIMRFIQRLKFKRFQIHDGLAAGLTLASFFVIMIVLVALFVPMFLTQVNTLTEVDYQAIGESLEEPINRLNERLHRYGLLKPDEPSPIEKLQEESVDLISSMASSIFGSVLDVTSAFFINLFSITFITFFFLKEENLMKGFFSALMPEEQEAKIVEAISDIQHLLQRYFIGIILQITTITLIVTVGLTILGIKNALLIGLFAGLVNVIPYLGPLIGGAFGMFIVTTSNLDAAFYTELLPLLLKVVAVFSIVQLTDNFVLQPLIYSSSVKAHPLEIFIIILVGATVYGVIGMILAVPAYTVLRVIARTFLMQFKVVQKMTKRLD
jgi:predicted PurR-regulated permease PerM